jgi:hypothetical protein
MSKLDEEFGAILANAIAEAFAMSRRFLAVCTDPDGNVVRYGPFPSADEAEFYASQRTDHDIRIEDMNDVSIFEERMARFHHELHETRRYNKAMAIRT